MEKKKYTAPQMSVDTIDDKFLMLCGSPNGYQGSLNARSYEMFDIEDDEEL